MKKLSILVIGLPLLGGLIGTTYWVMNQQTTLPTHNGELQVVERQKTERATPIKTVGSIHPLTSSSRMGSAIHVLTVTDEKQVLQIAKKLPGIFRGDWGETPVYVKNDRVNFERAAYLSLTDDNENQPPATSQGYWRLLKKFKAINEEACFMPAPGAELGECDFTEAGSLKDKDLHGADLIKARLNGELGTANLSDANLSGAAVLGSLVISPETRINHANLSGLQSDGNNPVIAKSANLSKVNFTKANLYGAQMQEADLTGATLTEAVLTGSQLASTRFDNANLNKTDMAYSNLSESSLTNAALGEANLEQADLSQADLSQANVQKANFAGANIAGTNFSSADLRGANLSAAQGADSAIIDNQTNFTSAICPDGVTVDGTQVTTCLGHGF